MISLQPRSIFQLTITGFLAVTGILVMTLIITANQLDGLSEQSQQIISQSVNAMRSSRTLTEQASAMERNALQYTIVGDAEILSIYAQRRSTLEAAAAQLSTLNLGAPMSELISSLIRSEALAYQSLRASTANSSGNPLYPRLLEITYQISDIVNQWTSRQLVDIRQETTDTKHLLTIQAVLLVSAALVLAGIFTALITRPLVQIAKAINQLGSGAYEQPIRISGPRDLMNLGSLLDWLRGRLGKLEQQRSSFLRHVSHELKTPLAAMQESASLLNDGVVGTLNSEQKNIMQIQSKNCQRLLTLIDDLLRYNSGSFSVLNSMPQPVRLDKLIETVLAAHELTLKAGSLTVTTRLSKATIRGDAEQLRVVIDNLLTNAIKYSPSGGLITISMWQDVSEVHLDVEDQGPGIAAAERDKVFEAFYQGLPPPNHFMKGSGLGLAITQEYTRINHGWIMIVDSTQGAHLQLGFPLLNQDER